MPHIAAAQRFWDKEVTPGPAPGPAWVWNGFWPEDCRRTTTKHTNHTKTEKKLRTICSVQSGHFRLSCRSCFSW
jgi:hypothetical protein